VELEYEHAVALGKPHFAIVVDEDHQESRVRDQGYKVDERDNPDAYTRFRTLVTSKMSKFWKSDDDIRIAILQKLPEWTARPDLAGWIRSDDTIDPATMTELARLSSENAKLRDQLAEASALGTYSGLNWAEALDLLRQTPSSIDRGLRDEVCNTLGTDQDHIHLGHLLEYLYTSGPVEAKLVGQVVFSQFVPLRRMGFAENAPPGERLRTSADGQRFMNRLALQGDLQYRLSSLWSTKRKGAQAD
jgi:hypothetical protein